MTPEESSLTGARNRCRNANAANWRYYGGRGIEYRLPDDVHLAAAWLVAAIGVRPDGHSLDRIDVNGHYEIGNLRWATAQQQARNKQKPYHGKMVAKTAYLDPKKYLLLERILKARGQTYSDWMRQCAAEYLRPKRKAQS